MICLFFAAVVWGLNYFYKSEYFKVKNIDIQNNTHYKDEEVKVLISEVIGANIFEINKKRVEETIARELNWVKEAELRKIFPDKVIIKLDERKPYLKIVYKDKYFLMDSEGVVLDKIEKEDLDEYKDLISIFFISLYLFLSSLISNSIILIIFSSFKSLSSIRIAFPFLARKSAL
ncbi:unnamed protein product [marine sediment metagenome]|uniref:POTRA domain-containing protein n=1 Tax=marine sediment metagenome TaxID=412755 RepID=X1BF28_9ZZZZ